MGHDGIISLVNGAPVKMASWELTHSQSVPKTWGINYRKNEQKYSPIKTEQSSLTKANKTPGMGALEEKERTKQNKNPTRKKKTLQDSRENGKMEVCEGGA